MRVTDTHVYFWGGVFSNFHLTPVNISLQHKDNSVTFKSSEHAFMAFKADYFDDWNAYNRILDAKDGKAAKAIGREVKNFDPDAWNGVCEKFMYQACLAKFTQNPELAQALHDTGNRILVEASPYDKIWGVGLGEDDPLILDTKNWQGKNLLGEVLMQVRKTIRDHNKMLNSATGEMLERFFQAMRDKASDAEAKYGFTTNWARIDWEDECRKQLREHVAKGDPRDVAIYSAFMHHHGWKI